MKFKYRQNQPLVIVYRAVAAPRWGYGLWLLTNNKKTSGVLRIFCILAFTMYKFKMYT